MNALDLFLREHAATHVSAVHGAGENIDWLLDGVAEDDFRSRPHGLNSMAWLLWHMARVEDGCVGAALLGQPPLLDAARAAELRVAFPPAPVDEEDVSKLSAEIDIEALLTFRTDVGKRTQRLVSDLWPEGWAAPLAQAQLDRGVAVGALDAEQTYLLGRPTEALLFWWGLHHAVYHLGQMALVRQQTKSAHP